MLSKVLTRSFRSSSLLLNYSDVRLTLFTKKNCGLCDEAKDVMNRVLKHNQDEFSGNITYYIVKIDDPKNKEWWERYCFDIPVLHIEDTSKEGSLLKIFHRLDENSVAGKIKSFRKIFP